MKTIVAIIALSALELYAMSQGRNGFMFDITAIAIAGLGGYSIRELMTKYLKK